MKSFEIFLKQVSVQQALLVDAFRTYLVTTKHSYSVGSSKSMNLFSAEFMNYVMDRPTGNKLNSKQEIKNTLKTMGIETVEDWTDLFNAIKDSNEYSHCLKNIKYLVAKKQAKKFHSHSSAKGLDAFRTIVIRSKYGNSPVKFYEMKGAMSSTNNPEVNEYKMEYHWETGCNYYEARPILYSSWVELDQAHQMATCVGDKEI